MTEPSLDAGTPRPERMPQAASGNSRRNRYGNESPDSDGSLGRGRVRPPRTDWSSKIPKDVIARLSFHKEPWRTDNYRRRVRAVAKQFGVTMMNVYRLVIRYDKMNPLYGEAFAAKSSLGKFVELREVGITGDGSRRKYPRPHCD